MEQSDIYFMRLAVEEAGIAFSDGEVPVGAVLVRGGQAVARAHNSRESTNDPTAHAEIVAMRAGAETWRLSDATLYVTKEPCVMCAGAMVNARLQRLVYGCKDLKAGAVDSLYSILPDRRLNHRVEVVGGVRAAQCAALLSAFFRAQRALGKK